MKCPFFGVDRKMGLRPPQVDEGDKDIGRGYFGGL